MVKRVAVVALVVAVLGVRAFADGTATGAQAGLESAWNDLEGADPGASRAMLLMVDKREETVGFLKQRVAPLEVPAEEVRAGIKDLGSEKEEVWRAAFEKFEYLDPRLAMDLQAVMDEAKEQPGRNRLIAVLGDRTVEEIEKFAAEGEIQLKPVGKGYYNFMTKRASWEAWANVEQLANRWHIAKKSWERADRAIIVLGQIGTPAALALVKEMTTGHADAEPTRTAKRVLAVLEGAATQQADWGKAMEGWWADLENPLPVAQEAVLKFAGHPAETAAFLKPRLVPLKITDEEVEKLIEALSSEKEEEWKPAFEKMEYFDPRLAIELPVLMRLVTEEPARGRLVDVLTDVPAGTFAGQKIRMSKVGKDEYDFFSEKGSWGAEVKVSRLESAKFAMPKKKWRQAMRGVLVLGYAGTPEAVAILKGMAGGNEEALPTRVAVEELGRIGGK